MENIDIRLRLIEERITNKEFLQSKKIAGEVPFYIFDYPPEYELKVRKYAKTLTEKIKKYYGISVIRLNLLELYMEILEDKDIKEDVLNREREIGSEELGDILINIIEGKEIADKIGEKASDYNLVILDGVGSVYPLIRTHSTLNKLQPTFNNNEKPVLMFFPGSYTTRGLSLFDIYPSDYYYRAFKIVEDEVTDSDRKEIELEVAYNDQLNEHQEKIVKEHVDLRETPKKDLQLDLSNLNLSEREIFIVERLKASKELYERDLTKILIKEYGKSSLISGLISRINRKVDTTTGYKNLIIHETIGENNKFIYNA